MIGQISHAYVEVYSAGCLLLGPRFLDRKHPTELHEKGRYEYPWRGGYSALNFFRGIYARLPLPYRPKVIEMAYASPGFIEIAGYCAAFAFVVRTATVGASRILAVAREIENDIQKRKLNKLEERQRNAHVGFIEHALQQLTFQMQLPSNATKRLGEITDKDAWSQLKIELSIARRIGKLAEYEQGGIATLEDAHAITEALRKPRSGDQKRKLNELLATDYRTAEPSADFGQASTRDGVDREDE